MGFSRKTRSPIIIGVLVGLMLRSLIASGLMITGGDGLADFSLVICPTQNRSLNFEILRDGNVAHRHHGHGPHSGNLRSENSETDSNVHAESLDPACLAWVGSGDEALKFAPTNFPSSIGRVGTPISPTQLPLTIQIFDFSGPRGPPRTAKSLFS